MSKNISNSYTSRDELLLRPEAKRRKRPLTIHIEDRLDRNFWMKIFAPYAEVLDINYVWQHTRFNGHRETTSSGKTSIILSIRDSKICPSETEIACIDADYDLLIEDDYTQDIKSNPYIFTTEWHSVENIICHHNNIKAMFFALSEQQKCPDFKAFLEAKAQEYSLLFLLHLSSHQFDENEYPIGALTGDIESIEKDELTVPEVLEQHKKFLTAMQDYLNTLEGEIKVKGYERDDYYKIMQGHLLKSQIVYPFIKALLTNGKTLQAKEEQRLESHIEDFFLFGYSVEHLDITQEIRKTIASVLKLT